MQVGARSAVCAVESLRVVCGGALSAHLADGEDLDALAGWGLAADRGRQNRPGASPAPGIPTRVAEHEAADPVRAMATGVEASPLRGGRQPSSGGNQRIMDWAGPDSPKRVMPLRE
jgi:hypothetical protein